MDVFVVIVILSFALAGVLIFALRCQKKLNAAQAECKELESRAVRLASEYESASARLRAAEEQLGGVRSAALEKEVAMSAENAALKARLEMMGKNAEKQKEELSRLQESFRMEFRNMAGDILEEKAKQMGNASRETIDNLLKPFRNSIGEFRERVEAIYADENRQRGALQNEIRNLHELNRKITEETTNLTNALKSNSKVQGDWGEMILQSLLENSNLTPGTHFKVQENIKDAEGNNLRPDVILYLPGRTEIVIDSKVSLTAYVGYCSDCEAPERDKFLRDHIASVRRHVEELGRKNYQQHLNSPDFIIMFVPNEAAYLCAVHNDTQIWSDAYRKKVILSSPTNLIALLKMVNELWRRDDQDKNAIRIAEEGGRLYDKFVGFIETFEALGRNITNASGSYEKALKQISTGNGNIVSKIQTLHNLGVKANKSLASTATGKASLGEQEPERQQEP